MLPALSHFNEAQLLAYALVFIRVAAFVVAWPVFGANTVPAPVKILFALVLTTVVYPVADTSLVVSNDLILWIIREALIGVIMGFMMRMFFYAINICGELISISIGLGAAQIFNPAMGSQSNVVEQLQLTLATLLFLALNGHHMFIMGLAQSFHFLPVGQVGINTSSFAELAQIGSTVIEIGLKISSPVIIAVLLTNLAMGILGRAVPQINVFVTSMPVTLMIGMGVIIFTLPLWISEIDSMLDMMSGSFIKMMKVL